MSEYSKENIKFDFNQTIEHIRKRPGMYIGNSYYDFFNFLFEFVCDFKKQTNSKIEIVLQENNELHFDIKNIEPQSIYNTFIDIVQEKVHWNNLAITILIGISESLLIKSNEQLILGAENGIILEHHLLIQNLDNNLQIYTKLDTSVIINLLPLQYNILNKQIEKYAFIDPNLSIKTIDATQNPQQLNVFEYKRSYFPIVMST